MNQRQAGQPRHEPPQPPPACDAQRMADQALMARIAAGDKAAFAALYDRYAARLLGLIMKLVRERAAAEDVLQEVFLHVWRKAGAYNPALASPLVWLMLTSRARAIDMLRRSGSETAAKAGWSSAAANGSLRAATPSERGEVEESSRAHAALAALPADQFEAISLAFHGGLTCAQIAQSRGVPLGTVKTRIRLGMIKLRDTFGRPREVTAS